MNNRLRRFRFLLLLALGAIALVGADAALSAPAPPPLPKVPPFPRPNVPPTSYIASPPVQWLEATSSGTPCGGNPSGLVCYTPSDMRGIYDVPASVTGAGQTIIIVDAHGSDSLLPDIAQFDAENGLPDPSLTIIGPNGSGNAKDPTVHGWAVETTLDVEWAHAFAPGAAIVLAISGNDNAHSLTQVLERAVADYPGAIVLQSFGGDETFVKKGFIDEIDAHRVFTEAVAMGDTILAAAGDWGASGTGDTGIAAWYPASDPLVTAVGGTEGSPRGYSSWTVMGNQVPGLAPDPLTGLPVDGLETAGGYGGEQAWNEALVGGGATGGAPSQLFPAPAYQQQDASGFAMRTVPDVSLNASMFAGSLIVFGGRHAVAGGTSVATAEWAGIFALVNEARAAAGSGPLGPANPALYALAASHPGAFHDVTMGNNTFDPAIPGFSAGTGYDLATGLGTPDVAQIVGDLAG